MTTEEGCRHCWNKRMVLFWGFLRAPGWWQDWASVRLHCALVIHTYFRSILNSETYRPDSSKWSVCEVLSAHELCTEAASSQGLGKTHQDFLALPYVPRVPGNVKNLLPVCLSVISRQCLAVAGSSMLVLVRFVCVHTSRIRIRDRCVTYAYNCVIVRIRTIVQLYAYVTVTYVCVTCRI